MNETQRNIVLMENEEGGAFFLPGPTSDTHLAEILWRNKSNDRIDVYRTFSDPSLRGQGIAHGLVDRVAAYARAHNVRIIPTCWYAKKVLEETPDYHDLIA